MRVILTALILMALGISLLGCISKPAVTSSTTTTPVVTSAAAGTFGALAADGQTVFQTSCVSCHGTSRALWGSAGQLSAYNTAQGLLSFIAATMPKNAPGSLSHQDYLNILSYLLIQNNTISSGTAFVESQLGSIALK
jgi:mono/diheme cytochrome c family protein